MKLHHPERYAIKYRDGLQDAIKRFNEREYTGEHLLKSLYALTPIAVYMQPWLRSILKDLDNPTSYTLLINDARLQEGFDAFMHTLKSLGGAPEYLQEEVMTAVKYAHSYLTWEMNGKRIYEVHPDLSWALQRTELHDFPAEDLHLPCSSLYLELPPTLQVPNRITGDHPCEGAFIMEELLDNVRVWRFMIVGGPGPSVESQACVDKFGDDDALFHYWMDLGQTTAQECIDKQLEISKTKQQRTYYWKGKAYDVIQPPYVRKDAERLAFNETLTATFRYIMNCVIYATTAESDVWFYEASKEYRDLKDRAMKATGEKRKRLFKELKNYESRTRYVMGSKTVIDRKRTKEPKGESEGRVLTKGGLVAGHWQRYWIGEGRKQCVRKLRLPFWRGPGEETMKADEGRRVTKLK